MDKIQLLIIRLQSIAKKNRDDFSYKIDINISRSGITYRFVATETADNHEFLDGFGVTIDDAVDNAERSIEACCKQWGYKA